MRVFFFASFFLTLAACTNHTDRGITDYDSENGPPASDTTLPEVPERQSAHATTTDEPPVDPAVARFAEVVHVFMRDRQHNGWMCTGTIVSERTVVTAAHCLDPAQFVSFEIVAPNAPKHPRVKGSTPKQFSTEYDDVANPDIGILTLSEPVVLDAYAEITDVSARLEAGENVQAAAVVRVDEIAEAPFQLVDKLDVSSTLDFGYEHGLGTPMFSKGGDSGAGLFLMEDGKPTHKLIGVARQPEPARKLDHFTRFDTAVLEWYAALVDATP